MSRVSVRLNSQSIPSAAYDAETQTLELTFQGGGTYTFEGVPENIFEQLQEAGSAGQFYHQQIKGRY
jgi:hypothetical protein